MNLIFISYLLLEASRRQMSPNGPLAEFNVITHGHSRFYLLSISEIRKFLKDFTSCFNVSVSVYRPQLWQASAAARPLKRWAGRAGGDDNAFAFTNAFTNRRGAEGSGISKNKTTRLRLPIGR